MTNQTSIERVVMRRVRFIRILGLILSTVTLCVLTSIVALWGIGREVWVARVLENMPSTLSATPTFFLAALTHTTLLVQVLTVLTLISFVFLVREMYRALYSFVVSESV